MVLPGSSPKPVQRALDREDVAHRVPAPLLWPTLALLSGVGLSDAVDPLPAALHTGIWLAPATLLVLLLMLRQRLRPTAVAAGAALIALLVGFARHQGLSTLPPHHIANALTDEPQLSRLAGRIVTTPLERPALRLNPFLPFDPSPRTQFIIAVDELRSTDPPVATTGHLRVSIEAASLELRLGQRVQLTGKLFRAAGPRNPGELDWATWYRRQNLAGGFSVESAAHVAVLPDPPGRWHRLVTALRTTAQRLLFEPYADGETDESTRLLDVMVLGQRSRADQQLNEAFLRAGGLHFLAVSGFNVALLAGFVWLVVRRFLRRSRRVTAVVTMIVTLAFAAVTEPNAPILRATLCVLLAGCASLTDRPFCALNWLALSAACIVLFDPQQLFNAGFQLSFVQVLALITLVPRIYRGMFARRPEDGPPPEAATLSALVRLWAVHSTVGLIIVCVCAYLIAQPLVLYHFGHFAPWGWLGTIVLAPLVTIITVLSMLTLAANALLPPLGAVLGALLYGVTRFLLWSVGLFEQLPYAAIDCLRPPLWLVGLSYTVPVLWIAWPGLSSSLRPLRAWIDRPQVVPQLHARMHRPLVRPRSLATICLSAVLVVSWLGWIILPASRDTGHSLHVLSVGNGSSMILTTPTGAAAVVDIGTDANSDGGAIAARALVALGVRRVNILTVSHGNFDHCSGLPTLLRRATIDRWATSPYFAAHIPGDIPPPERLRAWQSFAVGDAGVDVLWPPADLDATWEENNRSLVLRVTVAGRTFLLTGDCEDAALSALLAAERAGRLSLRADVLIAPHHGQIIPGATDDFLAAVAPQTVIVSARTPRPKLTALAQELLGPGVRVLMTGPSGAIAARVTAGGELHVETAFARP